MTYITPDPYETNVLNGYYITVNNVLNGQPVTSLPGFAALLSVDKNSSQAQNDFTAFLQSYKGVPSTTSFINAWITYLGSNANSSPNATSIYNSMFADFQQIVGFSAQGGEISYTPTEQEFNTAFNYFLASNLPSSTITGSQLFTDWADFFAYTASVSQEHDISADDITENVLNASGGYTKATLNFPQDYYTAYSNSALARQDPNIAAQGTFPSQGDNEFNDTVNSFINAEIAAKGFFSLGRSYNDWVNYLKGVQPQQTATQVINPNDIGPVSNVRTSDGAKVTIVMDIIGLVAQMTQTLQNVAAAQADYLQFLTKWQAEYQTVASQIQLFSPGDNNYYGDVDTGTATSDLNINQVYTERRSTENQTLTNDSQQLMSYRDAVGSTAKQQQTRINQTQDEIQNQSSTATSLLQQLTTILSSIFR